MYVRKMGIPLPTESESESEPNIAELQILPDVLPPELIIRIRMFLHWLLCSFCLPKSGTPDSSREPHSVLNLHRAAVEYPLIRTRRSCLRDYGSLSRFKELEPS